MEEDVLSIRYSLLTIRPSASRSTACFVSLSFAGLVVLARSLNPIPSRTRPLDSSAPMVLWLKPWESRSLPGLPRTRNSSLRVVIEQDAAFPSGKRRFFVSRSPQRRPAPKRHRWSFAVIFRNFSQIGRNPSRAMIVCSGESKWARREDDDRSGPDDCPVHKRRVHGLFISKFVRQARL